MNLSIKHPDVGEISEISYISSVSFVINDILEETPVEKIIELMEKHPDFGSAMSGPYTLLSRAAEKGNITVLNAILERADDKALNFASRDGVTALFFTVHQIALKEVQPSNVVISDKVTLVPEMLCKAGADVNLANRHGFGSSAVGKTPADVTPIWVAAEQTSNIALIKLFIEYGAIIDLKKLSEKGIKQIREAIQEMFPAYKILYEAMLSQDSNFHRETTPIDITRYIISMWSRSKLF